MCLSAGIEQTVPTNIQAMTGDAEPRDCSSYMKAPSQQYVVFRKIYTPVFVLFKTPSHQYIVSATHTIVGGYVVVPGGRLHLVSRNIHYSVKLIFNMDAYNVQWFIPYTIFTLSIYNNVPL